MASPWPPTMASHGSDRVAEWAETNFCCGGGYWGGTVLFCSCQNAVDAALECGRVWNPLPLQPFIFVTSWLPGILRRSPAAARLLQRPPCRKALSEKGRNIVICRIHTRYLFWILPQKTVRG